MRDVIEEWRAENIWSMEEHDTLVRSFKFHGGDIKLASKAIPNKTSKQCMSRLQNICSGKIRKIKPDSELLHLYRTVVKI